MKLSTLLCAVPFVFGCTGGSGQVLTGRIAPGFPSPITAVEVLQGSSVVTSARVAADGSFRLVVAPGSNLALRAVGAGQTAVVFPRHSGAIDSTFAIRGAGVAFDLGSLHYIGSSSTTTFAFHDGAAGGTCNADDQDSTGATCVDDGDAGGGTCGPAEGEQGGDSGSAESGSGDAAGSPQADDGDAVAEHNFPADGCADGNDNGGDDGSGAAGSDAGSDSGSGSGG